MKRLLFIFILLFCYVSGRAQIERPVVPVDRTALPDSPEEEGVQVAPIELYNIISVDNDTTHVDTSLTLSSLYSFNLLREDNFGKLPFPNVGQTYTTLIGDLNENFTMLPEFGARARHYNFYELEDVFYYWVATPFTELFFKTVFEQGQSLDALFTVNTSEYLNFSLAYKGHKSLGRYRDNQVSSGNFRATLSYNSRNDRYHLKSHFVAQDLTNEENGGLTPFALEQFLLENPEFQDRSRLEVNFEDAENLLLGKRFFLKHSYELLGQQDTVEVDALIVGHQMTVVDTEFHFRQDQANEIFGLSFEDTGLRDETSLEFIQNELSVGFGADSWGAAEISVGHNHFNYGYNTIFVTPEDVINNRIIGDIFSAGAVYEKEFENFIFEAEGDYNFSGRFTGHQLRAGMLYAFSPETLAALSVGITSEAPNFNFLLHQSDYINYNWENDFENEDSRTLRLSFLSEDLVDLEAEIVSISNHAFFSLDEEAAVKPFQSEEIVSHFKIGARKEFEVGKFALRNSLAYQKVFSGEEFLNLPTFVTRNTLYYSDHWFQKALYLQTGFNFNYFTGFKADAYDPVLGEFYLQNHTEIEGVPSLDFFFNGKVRTARIYFQLENINFLLTGNDYLVAPAYPYRDFAVRFGLVWNFFL